MRIRLLAFASVSDILGRAEGDLSLTEGSSIRDLKELLESDHPELKSVWQVLAVAVNGELSTDETTLDEGDEVALLPPVSGGTDETPVLQDSVLDVAAVAREVADPSCGALAIFVGNVRDQHQGREVESITYSAYPSMATSRIRTICHQLEESSPGARIAIVHRLGDIDVGEASVVIAVSSPHRAAAYDASREALERLKTEVPIWKKEHYKDGEILWREEESLSARARRLRSGSS